MTLCASIPKRRFLDSCPLSMSTGRPNSSNASVPTAVIVLQKNYLN